MRWLLLSLCILATGCASGVPTDKPPAMRYSHDGFSVNAEAAQIHQTFDQKIQHAMTLIAETNPADAPVTLVYVSNTINLVDTPTSFTRDMGGAEAPTARIAAARQYRGSGLRVIDPNHFSANMQLDCQNASNGARVFQLKTYVSNYDPEARRRNHGPAPYLQDDNFGFDLSRQSGSTTDVFTIETELVDCFGNVLRALSPIVEVTSVTKGQTIFLFSELLGVYGNRSRYVSTNLNGAKKRAIELVVAEIGMYMAGVPNIEIEQLFAPHGTMQ